MGRFDNRASLKMRRRKGQSKKKARELRKAEEVRASRVGKKKKKKH